MPACFLFIGNNQLYYWIMLKGRNKIGKEAIETDVDEDVMEHCTSGLHFTSLEFISFHIGNTILECEVALEDIITVQNGMVRARKCKVIRKFIRRD